MSFNKKPATRGRYIRNEFDVDLTCLYNRQLFIQQEINEDIALEINKQLFALDTLNHNPIMLYIDSPGGSCSAGLSIINVMQSIESPIVTIIIGEACSMAGQISIAGDKRVAYETSVWMAHDGATDMSDYFGKLKDRAKFLEAYDKLLENHLRTYTKLSNKEIDQAKNGELWLFADQMLEKGVIDEIVVPKN